VSEIDKHSNYAAAEPEALLLLRQISVKVTGIESKIDANALAMSSLTAKLDKLESVVEQLECDVRENKRNTVVVGAVSGATASMLVVVGWEILKARIGL